MNNRFHKVIFSQSQQQFVVVSELAKSSGKSSAMPKTKVDEIFSLLFENLFGNKNPINLNTYATLSNGKVEQVLVPKVYALAQKGDITGKGALLSGNLTHGSTLHINCEIN